MSLRARAGQWKLVIDFPFDVEHYTPRDDLAKLEVYRQRQHDPSSTLVWIPSFLSREAQRDQYGPGPGFLAF